MNEIRGTIRRFILEHNPYAGPLGFDDDLIDSRAISSVTFVAFVGLLEDLSGREIDPVDLDIEDFRTLRRIEERFLLEEVAS